MKYIKEYNEDIEWEFFDEEEDDNNYYHWITVNKNHVFNKGDIVKIREDSRFYDQAPEIPGKIIFDGEEVLPELVRYEWNSVLFDNGFANNYRNIDLYLLDK